MIVGNKIYFKAVELQDLGMLKEWRNLPEYRKHFREYREINDAMQNKWFQKIVVDDKNTIMFTIFDKQTNKLIGCCGLCYINWIHRHADLSLYIGYNEAYIDDVGFAEDACKTLIDYAFGELNLHKVWTEIYEFDTQKKELYDKFNFHEDGVLRENYFYQRRWWGSRILSLLASDYI